MSQINPNADIVLTNIILQNDYIRQTGKCLLLVEGCNDKKFYSKLENINKEQIVTAKGILEANKKHKGQSFDDIQSDKKEILEIMRSLYFFPNLKNINVFAIVDRDFDDEYPSSKLEERIFSDSTHDLETMLINSDSQLLTKCGISDDVINNAFFKVYQLSKIKQLIHSSDICVRYTLDEQEVSKLENLFDGNKLNVEKAIQFFKKKKGSKNNMLALNLLRKKAKGILDKNDNVIIRKEINSNSLPNDFWEVVNGHDLVFIIRAIYLAKNKIQQLNSNDLINNYRIDNFKNTKLHEKLDKCKNIF